MSFQKGCGRSRCSASTGVCGNLTFGTGRLSDTGYWQFPCRACEKAWVKQYGSRDTESPEFRLLMEEDARKRRIQAFLEEAYRERVQALADDPFGVAAGATPEDVRKATQELQDLGKDLGFDFQTILKEEASAAEVARLAHMTMKGFAGE